MFSSLYSLNRLSFQLISHLRFLCCPSFPFSLPIISRFSNLISNFIFLLFSFGFRETRTMFILFLRSWRVPRGRSRRENTEVVVQRWATNWVYKKRGGRVQINRSAQILFPPQDARRIFATFTITIYIAQKLYTECK